MIYSVYSYATQLYDYYEGGSRRGTHASAPPRAPLRSSIGATPEGATWSLPFGAKKIGSGPIPKGRIAVSGVSLGSFDISELPRFGVIAGIAYLVWRALK